MILVDTNILSELMRAEPEPAVLAWIDTERRSDLVTSVIVQAEILYGIECLPEGRRRDGLEMQAAAIFEEDFTDRILPVTEAVVASYAVISAHRRRIGRKFGLFDMLIAATAKSVGARIATRNTSDFDECGVELINPWGAR